MKKVKILDYFLNEKFNSHLCPYNNLYVQLYLGRPFDFQVKCKETFFFMIFVKMIQMSLKNTDTRFCLLSHTV